MIENKKTMKRTEDHRRNISESRKGMKFTEAHKRNMRRAKRIRSTLTIRTPYGDYPSFNEAGRKTDISYKTIFNRCNNPKPKWTGWQVIRKGHDETEKSREERWVAERKRRKEDHQKKCEDMKKALMEARENWMKRFNEKLFANKEAYEIKKNVDEEQGNIKRRKPNKQRYGLDLRNNETVKAFMKRWEKDKVESENTKKIGIPFQCPDSKIKVKGLYYTDVSDASEDTGELESNILCKLNSKDNHDYEWLDMWKIR